jgi:hypothetical protein
MVCLSPTVDTTTATTATVAPASALGTKSVAASGAYQTGGGFQNVAICLEPVQVLAARAPNGSTSNWSGYYPVP